MHLLRVLVAVALLSSLGGTLPTASVLMSGTTPALEVLYTNNPGAEIVGALISVLSLLRTALCPSGVSTCAAFEAQRELLWTQLGSSMCGLPAGGYAGSVLSGYTTPVDAGLEVLLARCTRVYSGNLSSLVLGLVSQFSSFATTLRPDVSAVLLANAELAGITFSDASPAQLLALEGFDGFPNLAPAAGLTREPAIVFADPAAVALDTPTQSRLVSHANSYALPASTPSIAWASVLPKSGVGADTQATIQSPDAFVQTVQSGAAGTASYQQRYMRSPSPLARYDPTYCATAAWDDDGCFPPVTPLIGLTHDAYGNRLLDDRGQPLPQT